MNRQCIIDGGETDGGVFFFSRFESSTRQNDACSSLSFTVEAAT
jgi:hypothetical protein